MSTKSKNSKSLLGVILILLLLALNAYQWLTNSKLKSNLNEKKAEYIELEKLNTELDQDYQAALTDLEELRGDNQELNALIDTQVAELAEQKKRISGLIWTERELGKARKEMNNMQSMVDGYVAEITQLKEENEELSSSNQMLTSENTMLSTENEANRKKISNLDSVKTVLVSKTEDLSNENTKLSSKVEMAEAIKINFLEVTGYDIKDNGNEAKKSRASKIEMLRTCFTTESNYVTPAGEKEFLVRYTSPSGELLYVEDLGSGTFVNKFTGKTERYTASGTAMYNNDDLNACLDWKPNFQLSKGIYKVEIFNNGFNVGNGEFKLK